VGGDVYLIEELSRPTDPGFGGGRPAGGDPDYGMGVFPHPGHGLPGSGGRPDQGLPGGGHIGNALPIAPVRPSNPIVLPPGMWPPTLPPGVDNTLPPGQGGHPSTGPIVIPPDPSIGIDQPIYLPQLPAGTALLIALPAGAQPKEDGVPPTAKPAILVQSGKKPVLVYVSAAAAPK
jgi:hypothetical protein